MPAGERFNPDFFDPATLVKPCGVPDEIWDYPEARHRYVKDWPHPPFITTSPCSGNERIGNRSNHAGRMVLVDPVWREPRDPNNPDDYGEWDFTNATILTDWLPQEKLPETIQFGELVRLPQPIATLEHQTYLDYFSPVEKGGSHSLCPECETDFRSNLNQSR